MGRINQRWHRVEVTGKGMFPIDMLRHDQCFPISESDSEIIRHSFRIIRSDDVDRIVALGHWGPSSWSPTAERWKSYGWTVTHHEVMR